jgi:glycosyltransferase involved in cell wall biosynthesis
MATVRVCAITFDWYPFDPLVRRMSEAAIEGGHAVDVICLRQPDEKKFEVCNGVRTYRVPMNRGFGGSLPATILNWCWFMVLAGATVTRLHRKQAYDVIHVHNMPDFLVFAALIPKILGAKVVLEVQDVSPELMAAKAKGRLRPVVQFLANIQERVSTAFSDHVITVGWPFEQLLLKRGVPAKKMTIILNSADPSIFPPSRRPAPPTTEVQAARPFVVIYHGTLAKRTGMDIAIRALALARQEAPQIRLHIKGRGEFRPYLQGLAAELGVSEAVEFTDPCRAEEIVDFVVQGDIGIIPYRHDGFEELVLPTKAYEYSWMHIPIIASNTVGIRSMFRPESIVLCEPEHPEGFAKAILDLYQHPEKRAEMILSAAEDYIPYEWETMSKRYCQLLIDLQCARSEKNATKKQQSVVTSKNAGVD